MPHYRQVGNIPTKRHVTFRNEAGGLFHEELVSHEGFSSQSALLYHQHPPTALAGIEPLDAREQAAEPNYPLRPRHFRCHHLDRCEDAVLDRHLLLANDDCRISYVVAGGSSSLYKNAVGDELVYVEAGSGTLETPFGALQFVPGDHVVIPRSTIHRWVIDGADGGNETAGDSFRALVIEASGHISPPRRYLSEGGQFLEHAPYCERDMRAPSEPLIATGENVEVFVRHRTGMTKFIYRHHPFDVVGWDGCAYPYTLSIHDFEPITGRLHQPPSVHQTFEAPNFVVCAFVPRMYDYHPQAIPAPYFHSNVDTDEVLFYISGDFMSRKGAAIESGSLTLHPAGHTHGPQPGSVEASLGKASTEELALMIDTFRPLTVGADIAATEDTNYLSSWLSPNQ